MAEETPDKQPPPLEGNGENLLPVQEEKLTPEQRDVRDRERKERVAKAQATESVLSADDLGKAETHLDVYIANQERLHTEIRDLYEDDGIEPGDLMILSGKDSVTVEKFDVSGMLSNIAEAGKNLVTHVVTTEDIAQVIEEQKERKEYLRNTNSELKNAPEETIDSIITLLKSGRAKEGDMITLSGVNSVGITNKDFVPETLANSPKADPTVVHHVVTSEDILKFPKRIRPQIGSRNIRRD